MTRSKAQYDRWVLFAVILAGIGMGIIVWPGTSEDTVVRVQTAVAIGGIPALFFAFVQIGKEIRNRDKVFDAKIFVLDGRPNRSDFHDVFSAPNAEFPTSLTFGPANLANPSYSRHNFFLSVVVHDDVMLQAPMLTVWWDDVKGQLRPDQVTTDLGNGFQLELMANRIAGGSDYECCSYRMFSPTGYLAFKNPVVYGFSLTWNGHQPAHTCTMHCELWGSNLNKPVRQDITLHVESVDQR